MQLRTSGWVAHLVVFESADKRIFSVAHDRTGRDVLRDTLEIVRLEPTVARREIGLGINHQFRKVRFVKRLDARGQRGVAQNKNWRAVFARDPGRFDRDVKTIFYSRWSEHDARAVAMAAEDGLMQIALFNVCRKSGARAATLNIANDERDLRH
jgi:hypothetical protein